LTALKVTSAAPKKMEELGQTLRIHTPEENGKDLNKTHPTASPSK
jgi:hypothetical protein